jgi:hypothetical protein
VTSPAIGKCLPTVERELRASIESGQLFECEALERAVTISCSFDGWIVMHYCDPVSRYVHVELDCIGARINSLRK